MSRSIIILAHGESLFFHRRYRVGELLFNQMPNVGEPVFYHPVLRSRSPSIMLSWRVSLLSFILLEWGKVTPVLIIFSIQCRDLDTISVVISKIGSTLSRDQCPFRSFTCSLEIALILVLKFLCHGFFLHLRPVSTLGTSELGFTYSN